MPELSSYDYALIRVVPDLERGEFLNAGILLFSKEARSLLARVHLDEARLESLGGSPDIGAVQAHLEAIERIAAGGPDAGPLGHLSPSQRFHWLVAPRSTMIQTSAVHSGLCADPVAEAARLFERLVDRDAGLGARR